MQHIGENWEANEACVSGSFDGSNRSGDSTILRDNNKRWIDLGTMYWPMITMNNMTFRGDITAQNILEDICANLKEKPQVCIDLYAELDIEFTPDKKTNVISAEMLIIIVTVLVVVNVILILAYRRCVKKEMEENMGFKV